ncbi:MAG: hypothetical protein ACJA00_002802 [Myxococcota bacterium]
MDRYEPGIVDSGTDVSGVMTTVVVSIEPSFGTNAGEQLVVIDVDAVGDDLTVMIGGEAAEVVSTDGTAVTVRTPRAEDGAADVVVSSGGGSGTLDDGYWFWEDAAGAFGTIGEVTYYDYTGDLERLGYLDGTTADIRIVQGSFEDFAVHYSPAVDMCQLGVHGNNTVELNLQAPDIQLQSEGSQAFSVVYDSEAGAYTGELSADASTPGVVYGMLPFQGAAPFPAFGIDPIADLAGVFTVDLPDLNEQRAFSESIGANVGMSSFFVEWSRPDAADYVIIELIRWGPNANNTEWEVAEAASCVVEDDGTFRIPPGVWTAWDLGAPVDVYVSRVRTTETLLTHNNGVNGVVGRSLVGGTVWQAIF